MNKVTFLSRKLAAQLRPPEKAVLISIYDKSEQELVVRPGWEDVLYVRCHDTDNSMMGLEVFTTDHAKKILDFVVQHLAQHELVVHCQMGQSRSAAVALLVSEKLGIPCQQPTKSFQREQHPHRRQDVLRENYLFYNRWVYRVLSETALGPAGAVFRAVSAASPQQPA